MKYLCIKKSTGTLIKGETYHLEKNPNDGDDMYLIDKKWTISEYNLNEFFILFAEFREQRINKILEE